MRGFDGGLDLGLGALVVLAPSFWVALSLTARRPRGRRGLDGACPLRRSGGWFCPVVCAEAEQLTRHGFAGQYAGIADPAHRLGVAATAE